MNDTTIDKDAFAISDGASLQQTIAKVQARIKLREVELKDRLGKLPKEGLRSAASMALPAFLTSKAAGSSVSAVWNLAKLATGQKRAILPLVGAATKAGLFTLLKKGVKTFTSKKGKPGITRF